MTEYWIVGPAVLAHVDAFAPEEVYDEFYDLLELLVSGPNPQDQPGTRILPLQDPTKPNGFTAPFDAGLVAYQIMRDQPVVVLVDVFWLDEADGPGQFF